MNADEAKGRIRAAVESWSEAARQGKERPRRKRPECATEKHAQAKVIAWLEQREIVAFHPANAGARNPSTATSQGIRAGVPDIIIATPPPKGGYRAAAIEMKRQHGGNVSMEQMRWLEKLRACGWATAVCEGEREAIATLEAWGYGP